MIDTVTNEPLVVNGEALTGSNIIVGLDQVGVVTDALSRAGVTFWVRHHKSIFNPDSRPMVAIVSLSRTSDTADVQRLLDSI